MTKNLRSAAFLVGLSLLASGLSACTKKPVFDEDDNEELVITPHASSGSCGKERWSVKTGTDSQAGAVNLTPQDTTVAALSALAAPTSLPASSRISPTELQTFRLTNVTLVRYKLENDSDYHVDVTDGPSPMITEIPDPACVGAGSPFAAGIAAARAAFDAKFNVTNQFQTANIPATITGVAFFDAPHGQTGMAPNAIELHTILSICFGKDCGGGATPDFSLSANPPTASSSGGAPATSSIAATASGGFSGNVSLAVSGVPAGATAALSATSVAANGSSTLTLTPGRASAGSYTVTIAGTSGSLRHSTSVAWTIAPAGTPDFSLIASPAAVASAGGASAASTITLAGTNGFSALVRLATIGVPTGASASFNATSITGSGSATLTLQPGSAAAGAYNLTVTGTSGALSHSATVAWSISAGGGGDTTPPAAQIRTPAAGATVAGTITIVAVATDDVSVSKIEMYLDGSLIGIASSSQYSQSWDSTTVPNGGHALSAKAYDPAGNVGTSPEVSITVNNSVQPPPQQDLIVNGGFEGTLSPWTAGGAKKPIDSSAHAHAGGYSLRMGWASTYYQEPNGDSWAYQRVAIPAGSTSAALSFWYYAQSYDGVAYDWQEAYVLDTNGNVLVPIFHMADDSRVWTQHTVDLSKYSGRTVLVYFNVHLDGAYDPTTLWVDDVSLMVNGAGGGGGDTTPPATLITAPANGATVSGTVAIAANASDDVSVTRVEFYLDGALLGTSTSPPYGASWNTAASSNGSHALGTKAYDPAGNVGSSAAVTVTVANGGSGDTTPPVTAITTPSNGSTVSGAATISATASDDVSVSKVEFYVDGTLLLTATSAPYSASWNTTAVSNGAHALATKAYDPAGNVGTSAVVNVTVNNATGSGIHTVFIIMMENKNWSAIKGSASAPYINGTLLSAGAHAENYVNLPGLHPSEPNYLWLEAGDNFGVTNDSPPSTNHQGTTQHLVTLLQNAGLTWKAYQENISGTSCPLATSGLYAPKHLPMVFFDDVTNSNSASSQNCIQHVRPYSELASDLSRNTVPSYNFITPNLCNDMHGASGCPADLIATGDTWLSTEVPKILASSAYKNGGALFITWDESEGGDHPIGMIVLSPQVKPGHSSSIAYSHSSTLRTFEEIFHLSPMLGGAATATDLSDLFQTFP